MAEKIIDRELPVDHKWTEEASDIDDIELGEDLSFTKEPDSNPEPYLKDKDLDPEKKQKAEDPKKEESKDEPLKDKGSEDEPTYEIEGKPYTSKQIHDALKGSMMQADYTKKTQEVAELRKSASELVEKLTPLFKITEWLLENETAKDDLIETYVADHGDESRNDIEMLFTLDHTKITHPADAKLLDALKENSELIGNEELRQEGIEFGEEYKLTAGKVKEVQDWAVEHYKTTGQALSLENAYKIKEFSKLQKTAERKKGKIVVIPKNKGAITITKDTSNEKEEDIDNIDVSEYSGKFTK